MRRQRQRRGAGTSNTGAHQERDQPARAPPRTQPIDVVIFNGGYGDKYATDVHEPMYKKAHPKSEVKHQSTQAISTLVQPLFAGGNAPEFVNNSGEKSLDFGALVADGQLQDLTALWDAPSVDDPSKKVRDTVVPGTVDAGSFNGKPYVLYYVSTVFGIWYSGKLFKDNGWTAPKTWSEFTALLRQDQGQGHHPVRLRRCQRRVLPVERHPHQRREDRWRRRAQEHRQPRGRCLEASTRSSRPPQAWAEIGAKYI